MNELYKLGLNDEEVRNVLAHFPKYLEPTDIEVIEKIELLKYIECKEEHIRNIIITNPLFLDTNNSDILNLFNKLSSLNLNNLNLLFDSNPFLLNKTTSEIDKYINKKQSLGISLEDIIDNIETNPYIIDED